MTYAEKLKDPRWQKKRLEIFHRDNWTCQECHSKDKTLTVHHKYYIYHREPWDYDNALLITLCEECHQIWEDNKDIVSDFVKVLLIEGWSPLQLKELHELILSFRPDDIAFDCLRKAKDEYDKAIDVFVEVLYKQS